MQAARDSNEVLNSKEVAFKTAGKYAFKDALLKAKPILLEPIVNMEVTADRIIEVVYIVDPDDTLFVIHAMPLTTRRRRG